MTKRECRREHEVMDAVLCGLSPDRYPADLQNHIAECPICKDVLDVAVALHDDKAAATSNAQIPSADLVWWRAELRARQEAMRSASRPMTLVEIFAAAAGIGVSAALVKSAWPWLKTLFVLSDLSLSSLTPTGLFIAFALAVFVIAPVAMYLALSDE